jgi:hypothetical protein
MLPTYAKCKISNSREIYISPDKISTRDFLDTKDYNPHNVRLWAISNEYGYICAVWGNCEQDALDNAVDANFMDSMLVAEPDEGEEDDYARLGNAGECFDLTYCGVTSIALSDIPRGISDLLKNAYEAGCSVLANFDPSKVEDAEDTEDTEDEEDTESVVVIESSAGSRDLGDEDDEDEEDEDDDEDEDEDDEDDEDDYEDDEDEEDEDEDDEDEDEDDEDEDAKSGR